MAAGVRTLVNKPETTRKDYRIGQCQHTLRNLGTGSKGKGTYGVFSRPPHPLNDTHVVERHGGEKHLG